MGWNHQLGYDLDLFPRPSKSDLNEGWGVGIIDARNIRILAVTIAPWVGG